MRGLAGAETGAPSAVSQPNADVWLTVEADRVLLIRGTADWADADAEEIEALGSTAGNEAGLATELALGTNPAIVRQSGHLLGFQILPVVFATPVVRFNPERRIKPGSRQSTSTDVIAHVLRGAWGAPQRPDRVLH